MLNAKRNKIMKISRKAFTLIELLVVISIIAVLMSILMPALGKVREQAKKVVCSTRLKDLGTTFRLYRADNNDHLPPSYLFNSELNAGFAEGDKRWFVRIKDYYDLNRAGTGSVYDYNMLKCPVMEDWSRKNAGGIAARGIYGFNQYFMETGEAGRTSNTHKERTWWKKPSSIKQPSELPLVADLDTRDPLNTGREPGWIMGVTNPHPAAYDYGWMNGDFRSHRHNHNGPAPNHHTDCNFLMADNHVESRDVTKEGQWPWIGTTVTEQQSGRAFHPTRNP